MKKYTSPEIEITRFDSEDIITTSSMLTVKETVPKHSGKASMFNLDANWE